MLSFIDFKFWTNVITDKARKRFQIVFDRLDVHIEII